MIQAFYQALQISASLATYLRCNLSRKQDDGSRQFLPAVDTDRASCCNVSQHCFQCLL